MDETERRPTDGGGVKAGPRLRARRGVQREVLRKRYQNCGGSAIRTEPFKSEH